MKPELDAQQKKGCRIGRVLPVLLFGLSLPYSLYWSRKMLTG
jgi:hypothetical protein